MIVKCISNNLKDISKKLQGYAWTQNEHGEADISIGKCYSVFALMKNKHGLFYFVHTDVQNAYTLWWMPAELYQVVEEDRPSGWTQKTEGDEITVAYPSLFDWRIHEGIIDGEKDAVQTYLSEVNSDSTFPDKPKIDKLNEGFDRRENLEKYEKDAILAKERGYEWPEKSE